MNPTRLVAMSERLYPSRAGAEVEVKAYISKHGVSRLHNLLADDADPTRASWDDAKVVAAIVALSRMGLPTSDFTDLLRSSAS